MSEQPGLSIFDSANRPGEAAFPMARRGGYDTDAVDTFLRSRAADVQHADRQSKSTQQEITRLRKELEELKESAGSVERPSYSTLGGHAAQLLGLAEQEADDVRDRAVREAEEKTKSAEEEAAIIRTTAAKEAESLRTSAVSELEDKRKQLLEDAESTRAEAESHAEELRSQAVREAAHLKLAAEQEANNMRVGATRDVEQARAGADREVTEARRVLAVEKERLAREAAESHAAATQQTAKLVADSETRASAAEDRARQILSQANKNRESAGAESAGLLDKAKKEVTTLIASAKADADHIRASAATDVERQTRLLRAEVEDLQRKREGIMAQMGQLRDIVTSFAGGDSTPADKPHEEDRAASKSDEKAAAKPVEKAEPKAEEKPEARNNLETQSKPDDTKVIPAQPAAPSNGPAHN
ncbi:MAG: hypothetical protein H7288_19720 [Kineosporiaceae bacterium]|nr:hypothetical protein [Aeromicrobium sp.]